MQLGFGLGLTRGASIAGGLRPLIIEVDTSISGTTASDTFRLALKSGESYDFSYSTNDGTSGTHNTDSNLDLVFPSGSGVYEVEITPQDDGTGFAGFYYNNTNDDTKLTKIMQWGDVEFTYFADSFEGCSNLTITNAGTCNTNAVDSMRYAFSNCSSMITPPTFSSIANVTNVDFMFSGCNSMTTAPSMIFTSTTKNGQHFLNGCSSLTGAAPNYDMSSMINVNRFYQNCSGLTSIPYCDTGSVTVGSSLTQIFSGCSSVTTFGGLNFNGISGTAGGNHFTGCSSATTITALDNMTNVTSGFTFNGLASMVSFPSIDVSSFTSLDSFFRDCSSMVTAPDLTTTACTDMGFMFYRCTLLETVPVYDTAGVLLMDYTFQHCSALTSVPAWDYSDVTNPTGLFHSTGLTSAPAMDLSSATTLSGMFYLCSSLTTCGTLTTSTALTAVNRLFSDTGIIDAPSITVTSNVTNWSYMFQLTPLETCPTYDTSGGGTMDSMFHSLKSTTFDMPAFDFSAVTNLANLIRAVNPNGVRSTPVINAPLCTNATNFARDNYNLETIGTMTLTGLTTANHQYMFHNARNVRGAVKITFSSNVTSLNRAFRYLGANSGSTSQVTLSGTSSVTNFGDCFQSGQLDSINLIDTSSGTTFGNFLIGNTPLDGFNMPTFDLSSMTSGAYMFSGFAMTTASWEALLVATEANNSNSSVTWSGGNATYNDPSSAATARAALIADHSWTITDAGPV